MDEKLYRVNFEEIVKGMKNYEINFIDKKCDLNKEQKKKIEEWI